MRRRRSSTTRRSVVHPHHGHAASAWSSSTRRSTGCPSTSRTAGSATGWRTTSTGRSPASATGARRCRSGRYGRRRLRLHRLDGRAGERARAQARATSTCTGRTSTTVDVPLPGRAASKMRRVPEVVDAGSTRARCRTRSGTTRSRTRTTFDERFPADFICEAIDQTRGWFYTLHAIATMRVRQAAYKNVICLGHIVDADGKKMSKSQGQHHQPVRRVRLGRRRRDALALHRSGRTRCAEARLGRDRRGRREQLHQYALEHVRILRDVRAARRLRRARATCRSRTGPRSIAGSSRCSSRRSRRPPRRSTITTR